MSDKRGAVFTDLDGVFFYLVNHFGEYGVSARTEDEIKVVAGLGNELNILKDLGFVIVGHTNQPDIARGKISLGFLDEKHSRLKEVYPQFDGILHCPHTETDLCVCRKPKPGMLLYAAHRFDLDFSKSWVIGDSGTDIWAGHVVHANTILIRTPYNMGDPSVRICTQVVKSTKGALSLIRHVTQGQSNIHDS